MNTILSAVDQLLNRITMYRLVLYVLTALILAGMVMSALHLLPFTPLSLLFSTAVLTAICWITNELCAKFLNVQTNVESVYITAFILALIISPSSALAAILPFLFWVSVWAMASKYIFNIRNKHIFNPAAFAVALTSLTINGSASWWVGSGCMLAFVIIGGILVIKKVQKWDTILAFLVTAIITSVGFTFFHTNPMSLVQRMVLDTPLIFFAAIMLTEPLTMPPTKGLQITYGLLVGFLFSPYVHLGSFYFTPELALLAGNIFAYAVSPKGRHALKLLKKEKISEGVYNFVFAPDREMKFRPGQYMEWTLGHKKSDSRGNRRYFTLANAPTESEIILGVKFYEKPSSFKRKLTQMNPGETIVASQLAGDFVLPKDKNQKLVFVAGGIGITPFRSMIKFLIDSNERRDITVLYANRGADEIAYMEILEQAERLLGVKTIYILSDPKRTPPAWHGLRGYITTEVIKKYIPDFAQRTFYISGSQTIVDAAEAMLRNLGMNSRQIKTDFFPGLA